MIPTNEQGTVALFAKVADEMGYRFKEIGTHCPDAILEKDGKLIRVEFEYHSGTFKIHKHDTAAVDLIICWEDDWPSSPLPVLSLETYVTLTRPEPPRSFLRRIVDGWVELRMAWSGHNRSCPLCGTQVIFDCWRNDGQELVIQRTCPKCHYEKKEIELW